MINRITVNLREANAKNDVVDAGSSISMSYAWGLETFGGVPSVPHPRRPQLEVNVNARKYDKLRLMY
jgi:hypothetical protein